MEIISRKEAIARGLDAYYTGKPCPHGHYSPRRVNGRTCKECNIIRQRLKRNPNAHDKPKPSLTNTQRIALGLTTRKQAKE